MAIDDSIANGGNMVLTVSSTFSKATKNDFDFVATYFFAFFAEITLLATILLPISKILSRNSNANFHKSVLYSRGKYIYRTLLNNFLFFSLI